MRYLSRFALPLAASILGLAGAAQAAVFTLDGVTPVSNGFRFDYTATLGPDEGLNSDSGMVIFDFAGLVAGSVVAPTNFTGTSALTSPMSLVTPGQDDRVDVDNLVFEYTGPDVRTTGGPFGSLAITGFSAVSIFGDISDDGFTSMTVKNNGGQVGTDVFTLGTTAVPIAGAVPEAATWAMMITGFGLVGVAARRRRTGARTIAA